MIAKAKVIQIELARTDTIERGLDAVLSQINENGGEVPDEEVCK